MFSTSSKGPNFLNSLFYRQANSNFYQFRSDLYRDRLSFAKNLYKYDLTSHFGCVNAIEFSNEGELLVSGGDDRRVLLWNVEQAIAGTGQPRAMAKEHQSNIFCLSFNSDNTKLFSGGNDDAVIIHDVKTGDAIDVYLHVKPVYGLSVDPTNENILSTAGEDGRILLFDTRKGSEILCMGKYRGPFHAVQFHPLDGNLLVTANVKKGAGLWDIRKPQIPIIRYGGEGNTQSAMSIRFNRRGSQVLVLRRRLPPILYNTFSPETVCQFYHPDYYNSCTMKSCCFAGEDDEFVLSGSDDFNLYVWNVGDVEQNQNHQWIEQTKMVLYGHRSIVNQVRYNPQKCLIASSGVEKIVKLWSPFLQKDWTGSLVEEATGAENPRKVFPPYFTSASLHRTWDNWTHDYSNQNTFEDARMMGFFDSLVQQEIEGWNSNNSDSDQNSFRSSENSTRQSSTESSDEDLVNYFVHRKDRRRRGAQATSIKPQRTKYANRIAYLIATKRNTLRRLALKGASNSNRQKKTSFKTGKRKNRGTTGQRTTRSGNVSKRTGRYGGLSNRTTRTRGDEGEPSTKNARFKGSTLRSYRRKNKNLRLHDRSDSSSDDDDVSSNKQNGNLLVNNGASTSLNIAVPSTSTGITSNGKDAALFVRHQLQQDSDDDDNTEDDDIPGPSNIGLQLLPNIPKPKSNGILHLGNANNTGRSSQQSSDIDEDRGHSTNRRKRGVPAPSAKVPSVLVSLDIYSSHSNSRLSSSYLEDEEDSNSNESLDCFAKKRKMMPRASSLVNEALTSAVNDATGGEIIVNNINNNINPLPVSDGMENAGGASTSTTTIDLTALTATTGPPVTPKLKVNQINENITPDSGIGIPRSVAGCSSTSSNNGPSTSSSFDDGGGTSSDKFTIKLFHQKVARVRRNYRNQFGDESDSD